MSSSHSLLPTDIDNHLLSEPSSAQIVEQKRTAVEENPRARLIRLLDTIHRTKESSPDEAIEILREIKPNLESSDYSNLKTNLVGYRIKKLCRDAADKDYNDAIAILRREEKEFIAAFGENEFKRFIHFLGTYQGIQNLMQPADDEDELELELALPPSTLNAGTLPLNEEKKEDNQGALSNYISNPMSLRILRHIDDSTSPLSPAEHLILLLAISAAAASASTGKYFGENIVKALITEAGNNTISWVVAIPAIIAQFSFSSNSNMNLHIRIARYLHHEMAYLFQHYRLDELSQDWKRLFWAGVTVIPSICPTAVQGLEAFQHILPPDAVKGVCVLRMLGAFGTNADFFNRYEKDKQAEKHKGNNSDLVNLLLLVKKQLKNFANGDRKAYIQALNHGFLRSTRKTDPNRETRSFSEIIQQLLILEDILTKLEESIEHNLTRANYIPHHEAPWVKPYSTRIGFIVSLINWKTATKVAKLIGWPVVTSILPWIAPEISAPLLIGFILGTTLFGYGSSRVNTLINGSSTARVIDKQIKIQHEGGIRKHLGQYTKGEFMRLAATSIVSIFYGATMGGSAYAYPIVGFQPIAIAEALFASFVFSALGYMSIDTFLNTVNERWNRYLFTQAITAQNLETHYQALTPAEQDKVITLIDIYLNFVFNTLIEDCQSICQQDIHQILPLEVLNELANRFPQPQPSDSDSDSENQSSDPELGQRLLSSQDRRQHHTSTAAINQRLNINNDRIESPLRPPGQYEDRIYSSHRRQASQSIGSATHSPTHSSGSNSPALLPTNSPNFTFSRRTT